ncbi:BCD family MFS transporter [Candidatus Chloroploca sp. Khr17]|uniref:BCD family MFS transporter n=1 Tax=Candidatus Chloroploca sp. Khr17 TaxID=2496869 RepID=UPI001F0DA9A3|nr:BCD family MFS transporter [Candidatus Chloroploca sp. Khr17]
MSDTPRRFSVLRTMKIGSFHIGSSFVDLLTSGVLNRILISDLNIWAAPVALLSALRYLLAPLSIWAGYRSDTRPIFGFHRLPYIWGGRIPMLLSLPLLPIITVLLAANPRSILAWSLAVFAFLIYGVGTLLSGSTFLALVRDSAPPEKRGQAMSIVQTFLVISFPIAGVVYGLMMPVYDPASFWQIVLFGMGIATVAFFFSLLGEEQRHGTIVADAPSEQLPFRMLLREMWGDRRTRLFFLFLALGATSAFAQDAVLEPFGGDVFGLSVGETTRFNAYWGTGVVLSLIGTVIYTRNRQAHEQTGTTVIGLILTSIPLALLGVIALTEAEALLIPVLFAFGLGFGIYTVGAVSLLMAMTSDRRAGAYLGLWTVAQLLFRGLGILLGGLIRDLGLITTGSLNIAYGLVFFLEAIGLAICVILVRRVDVPGFARQTRTSVPSASLAAAAE